MDKEDEDKSNVSGDRHNEETGGGDSQEMKKDQKTEEMGEDNKSSSGQEANILGEPSQPKKPPGAVCHCPQKCGDKLSEAVRQELLTEFQKLGEAHKQNLYLQSFIEMRSVYKRLWCQEERVAGRLQRRVSCKYRLPYTVPKPLLAEKNQSPPKLTTNSKGKMTFIIGLRDPSEAVEVCQKAFMNVYGITEKRIRLQREKLIAKLRNDTIESMSQACEDKGSNDETDKSEPVPSATTNKDAGITQSDIALVDRFFRNQLWKPEYIGMPLTAKGTRRSKTM